MKATKLVLLNEGEELIDELMRDIGFQHRRGAAMISEAAAAFRCSTAQSGQIVACAPDERAILVRQYPAVVTVAVRILLSILSLRACALGTRPSQA